MINMYTRLPERENIGLFTYKIGYVYKQIEPKNS